MTAGGYPRHVRLRLDYGEEGLLVHLPHDRLTVVEPASRASLPDVHAALVGALRTPIGLPPLRELARRAVKIAVSVCDVTRPQPRREMLEALFEEMPDISPDQVT